MIAGLDVWNGQGVIDWARVRANGVRWSYLKCSEGQTAAKDPSFDRNVTFGHASSVVLGPYHVGHFAPGGDPIVQARAAFAGAAGLGTHWGDLPPALDFETPAPKDWAKHGNTAAQLRADAIAYLREMRRLSDRVPALYIYPDFWSNLVGGASAAEIAPFADFPLWLAAYRDTPPFPPAPWAKVTLWQASGGTRARVPNGAPVDTDWFMGDDLAFEAFCGLADLHVLPVGPVPLNIPGLTAPAAPSMLSA